MTDMLSIDPLTLIKDRHSLATPGPWVAEGTFLFAHETGDIIFDGDWYDTNLPDDHPLCEEEHTRNEDFVVHAWEDVRWLIREVEHLRQATEPADSSPAPS